MPHSEQRIGVKHILRDYAILYLPLCFSSVVLAALCQVLSPMILVSSTIVFTLVLSSIAHYKINGRSDGINAWGGGGRSTSPNPQGSPVRTQPPNNPQPSKSRNPKLPGRAASVPTSSTISTSVTDTSEADTLLIVENSARLSSAVPALRLDGGIIPPPPPGNLRASFRCIFRNTETKWETHQLGGGNEGHLDEQTAARYCNINSSSEIRDIESALGSFRRKIGFFVVKSIEVGTQAVLDRVNLELGVDEQYCLKRAVLETVDDLIVFCESDNKLWHLNAKGVSGFSSNELVENINDDMTETLCNKVGSCDFTLLLPAGFIREEIENSERALISTLS